jgi:UDP-glucose 4-epimerase
MEVIGLTPGASSRTDAAARAGIEIVYGRAEDAETLNDLLDRVDHVVFTVGGLLPAEAALDPLRDAARTIEPCIAMLEALRRHPDVSATLLSSGGAIYGNPPRLPVSEDDIAEPVSTYGASRLACSIYAGVYARSYDLRIQVARCANVYGPGQPHDRSQGAVAVFLHQLVTGQPITIYGDGSSVRDYVYVDDVATAISRLVRDRISVDVVNIGSGRGHTTRELLDAIMDVSGLSVSLTYAPERRHDVRAIVLDVSRLCALIDYDPVPLSEGVRLVWEHTVKETGLTSDA